MLLALKTKNLPVERWELVLPDALHSIRSLLCTATNATPHERMFLYNRRSTYGTTLPNWLTSPGPVLLKRHVRSSKYDPLVEEVELLESNPQYAHIRFPNGREDTVSIRDLAPLNDNSTIPFNDPPPLSENSESQNDVLVPSPSPIPIDPPTHQETLVPCPDALFKKQQRVHSYNLRNREA